MAKLNERTRVLQEMCVTEADIKQLYDLTSSLSPADAYDEAKWRIEHEYRVHVEWAAQRRDFMLAEIADLKPHTNGRRPVPIGPPIVRHAGANGRVSRGNSTYGERFG